MYFSAVLLCSLLASAFSAGYAPVPGVAPAPTSYGNPQQYNTQPLQNIQPLQNTQPVFLAQQQQPPFSTFNTAPLVSSGNFVAPPAPAGTLSGNGHLTALTNEDDWDSISTARGVKNQKFGGKRFHRRH